MAYLLCGAIVVGLAFGSSRIMSGGDHVDWGLKGMCFLITFGACAVLGGLALLVSKEPAACGPFFALFILSSACVIAVANKLNIIVSFAPALPSLFSHDDEDRVLPVVLCGRCWRCYHQR